MPARYQNFTVCWHALLFFCRLCPTSRPSLPPRQQLPGSAAATPAVSRSSSGRRRQRTRSCSCRRPGRWWRRGRRSSSGCVGQGRQQRGVGRRLRHRQRHVQERTTGAKGKAGVSVCVCGGGCRLMLVTAFVCMCEWNKKNVDRGDVKEWPQAPRAKQGQGVQCLPAGWCTAAADPLGVGLGCAHTRAPPACALCMWLLSGCSRLAVVVPLGEN